MAFVLYGFFRDNVLDSLNGTPPEEITWRSFTFLSSNFGLDDVVDHNLYGCRMDYLILNIILLAFRLHLATWILHIAWGLYLYMGSPFYILVL